MHGEVESERMLANIHGTFYEVPFWIVGQAPLYTKMRPVSTPNKQISDFTIWNGYAGTGRDQKPKVADPHESFNSRSKIMVRWNR